MKKLNDRELSAIAAVERHGIVTADALVSAAASPASPLHGLFTWDDTVAAQKWRIQEAREILKTITVQVQVETRTFLVPMYVHDPDAVGQCYRSTTYLAKHDPDRAKDVLRYTIATAIGHLVRARDLALAFGLDGDLAAAVINLQHIEASLSQADMAVV